MCFYSRIVSLALELKDFLFKQTDKKVSLKKYFFGPRDIWNIRGVFTTEEYAK